MGGVVNGFVVIIAASIIGLYVGIFVAVAATTTTQLLKYQNCKNEQTSQN